MIANCVHFLIDKENFHCLETAQTSTYKDGVTNSEAYVLRNCFGVTRELDDIIDFTAAIITVKHNATAVEMRKYIRKFCFDVMCNAVDVSPTAAFAGRHSIGGFPGSYQTLPPLLSASSSISPGIGPDYSNNNNNNYDDPKLDDE